MVKISEGLLLIDLSIHPNPIRQSTLSLPASTYAGVVTFTSDFKFILYFLQGLSLNANWGAKIDIQRTYKILDSLKCTRKMFEHLNMRLKQLNHCCHSLKCNWVIYKCGLRVDWEISSLNSSHTVRERLFGRNKDLCLLLAKRVRIVKMI